MNNKIFLVSPDDVKAASNINYNVNDEDVSSAIRTSQNIYLRDIIGDNLLEAIQEKVADGSIDEPENAAYLTLLDDYVSEYLTYQACVEITVPISLKIRNIGISQDYDTNITASALQNIAELADFYRTQAIDKANRLIDFLVANNAAFPEIGAPCACGQNPPHLKKKANTQLYLGF